MKTQNLKLKAVKLTVLAASLSVLASCAKSTNAQSSAESETLAGNIVNGVASTDAFQKENGVVGLVIKSDDGEGICSGTLISRKIVLTAAHCLDTSSSNIRSIMVVFTQDVKKATKETVRFGTKGRVHEAFLSSAGGTGAWNDIALLLLNEEAPANVKVARLPSLLQTNPVAAKMQLTQAGFGKTEATRFALKDTSGTLRQVSGIEVIALVNEGKELQLRENGKGSCNGDSGGPAYVKSADGKLTQVGVNSRGTDPSSCIGVGIFTNVAAHLQWIQKNSAALLAATAPAVK
ncbi:trypsin-like serine protease [bacterium]|nr:trypsin-like serine protease [bacterium]